MPERSREISRCERKISCMSERSLGAWRSAVRRRLGLKLSAVACVCGPAWASWAVRFVVMLCLSVWRNAVWLPEWENLSGSAVLVDSTEGLLEQSVFEIAGGSDPTPPPPPPGRWWVKKQPRRWRVKHLFLAKQFKKNDGHDQWSVLNLLTYVIQPRYKRQFWIRWDT